MTDLVEFDAEPRLGVPLTDHLRTFQRFVENLALGDARKLTVHPSLRTLIVFQKGFSSTPPSLAGVAIEYEFSIPRHTGVLEWSSPAKAAPFRVINL